MQRWSRARRKTERLIDFDGSSAVPRGVHTYSCQPTSCQLPARFYDYSCSSVADETFTRHKRPAPQICPSPVVVSDNSFHSTLFVPLYHLSRARTCSHNLPSYLYISQRKCVKNIQALRSVKQRSRRSFWNFGDFQHRFPYRVKTKIAEVSIFERLESHHVNVTNTS